MIHQVMRRSAGLALLALTLGSLPTRADTVAGQAKLQDPEDNIAGVALLRETPAGVLLHLKLQGLPPGTHTLHFHESGECKPPSFESAGGHYNPGGKMHGFLNPDGPHAGDMPNIHVPASGSLEIEVLTLVESLNSEQGLMAGDSGAIVIHQGADDYQTDPAGAAGPHIACGVIEPARAQQGATPQ